MTSLRKGDLDVSMARLVVLAQTVAARAYNPLSGAYVGAAILTVSGEVFCGTFYENSSGPVGVCAEQVAIGTAITAGYRDFKSIAIVGGMCLDEPGMPTRPCGKCLQAIAEFSAIAKINTVIYCCDITLSQIECYSLAELMPYPFLSGKVAGEAKR